MPPAPRVSVRKRHGLHLGNRIVECRLGPQKKRYRLHENLLCKSSNFFRNAIQPNRRAIEGDCSICHEELRSDVDELTYCIASCGCNFHEECIEKWNLHASARPRCPLCRSEWRKAPLRMLNLPTISDRGFAIYAKWLYRARIQAKVKDDGEQHVHMELIDAYSVGLHLDDQDFCKALLQAIVEFSVDDISWPGEEAVKMAYEKTTGQCDLRELLVGIYMRLDTESGDITHGSIKGLPVEFLRDLTMAFLNKVPKEQKVWTLEALTADLLPNAVADEEAEESDEAVGTAEEEET